VRAIDLAGKQFGKWFVTDVCISKPKPCGLPVRHWLCNCSCGKSEYVDGYSLRIGTSKSCGCDRPSPPTILEEGLASKRAVFGQYKKAAKKRGFGFNLSFEEFITLASDVCYYCGCGPSNKFDRPYANGSFSYNGVDRRNPQLGYFLENCVTSCFTCNFMKHTMTEVEFMNHIRKIFVKGESRDQ